MIILTPGEGRSPLRYRGSRSSHNTPTSIVPVNPAPAVLKELVKARRPPEGPVKMIEGKKVVEAKKAA
jgi:hypothetical protein